MIKKYDTVQMSMDMDNVLDLPDPQSFSCRVIKYSPSHSILSVELTNKSVKGKYLVHFENVRFFEGMFFWSGANFRTSNVDDYIDLLYILANKAGDVDNDFRELLLTQAERLFIVTLPMMSIKIVASAITMDQTLSS